MRRPDFFFERLAEPLEALFEELFDALFADLFAAPFLPDFFAAERFFLRPGAAFFAFPPLLVFDFLFFAMISLPIVAARIQYGPI
ncbi:MAG: hypothetical protein ACJ8F3_15575 [Xanthobacteraceae bacterium]